MDILRATRHAPGTIVVLLMCASMAAVNAQSNGTGGFGSARIGATGGYTGGFGGQSRSSSVINHGGTGFSIYSQQGVTRVIGVPRVSRKIFLPNGQSTRVIGDGRGGASVLGPLGNHRIFGDRPPSGNDSP
jgi:hypothetical protein